MLRYLTGAMLLMPIVLFGWVWFRPAIDSTTTYVIAESAFKSFAAQMSMPLSDFDPPSPISDLDGDRMVVLSWVSRSRPECRIEVDVDRLYANARPTWNCSQGNEAV